MKLRVAFVHDWLVTYRGGEKVLEAMLPLAPDAPIYTLFYDPKLLPKSITSRTIISSPWLNRMRGIRKLFLPFYPLAIESFDLNDFDLVISSSSCVAKGVLTGPNTRHLSYIHSPMRYIWDMREHYLREIEHIPMARTLINAISPLLRIWDVTSNNRVDSFIANSNFVKKRIKRYYQRDSHVVYPPIDLNRFNTGSDGPRPAEERKYFLACGAFVSYKRFDLAVKVCEQMGKRLILAGSGPLEAKLRKLGGKYTEVISSPDDAQLLELMRGAKALIFPGTEDFGLIPVETLACGTPVIAHNSGGALDYILQDQTGKFFSDQTEESLMAAILDFEKMQFNYANLVHFAQNFSHEMFIKKLNRHIQEVMEI